MAAVGGEINPHVRVKGGSADKNPWRRLSGQWQIGDKRKRKKLVPVRCGQRRPRIKRAGGGKVRHEESESRLFPPVMWLWWKACGEINFLKACHLLASFDPGWGGDWIDNSARALAHSAPSRLWMSCEIISSTPPFCFFSGLLRWLSETARAPWRPVMKQSSDIIGGVKPVDSSGPH